MKPCRSIPSLGWVPWVMLWMVLSNPGRAQSDPDAVEALFASPPPVAAVEKSSAPPPAADRPIEPAITEMRKRLDAIEARLGHSVRPPSVGYTMERRLADLEKRVQQIETQLARMQQFDQRIRRLEMK